MHTTFFFESESELKTATNLFNDQGYIGPYTLDEIELVDHLSAKLWKEETKIKLSRRIERLQKELFGVVFKQDQIRKKRNFSTNRHLDMLEIQDILKDKNLTYTLKKLCTPNLLLWRTFITRKGPGSRELGWHHDKHFENGNQPMIDLENISNHFSVIVALSDITETNGVFKVIQGSHKPIAGFERDLRIKANKLFADHLSYEIPEQLKNRVRKITLKKGQFLLFYSALLHGSDAYKSGEPRISLALRFMANYVDFPEFDDSVELKRNQLITI